MGAPVELQLHTIIELIVTNWTVGIIVIIWVIATINTSEKRIIKAIEQLRKDTK